MNTTTQQSDALLRLVLKVDAVVTGANGIAYLTLAGPLADLFDVPAGFLRGLGAFLAVFSVAVWLVALRPRPWAAAVIAANVPGSWPASRSRCSTCTTRARPAWCGRSSRR